MTTTMTMTTMTADQAMTEALAEEMRRATVLTFGERVATKGYQLVQEFGSKRVREGSDVTLISYGKTVGKCLEASEVLAGRGVSAEVLDLRSLKPLDEESILASVRRTGRAVIVHEAAGPCGVGAEVAAIVSEKAFSALTGPVMRVTGPDARVPASFPLEAVFVPSVDAIVAAVEKTGAAA